MKHNFPHFLLPIKAHQTSIKETQYLEFLKFQISFNEPHNKHFSNSFLLHNFWRKKFHPSKQFFKSSYFFVKSVNSELVILFRENVYYLKKITLAILHGIKIVVTRSGFFVMQVSDFSKTINNVFCKEYC